MITIKPVSDLRNYNTVLEKVSAGNPVYLTKNGEGQYVIYGMEDQARFERLEKAVKLMSGLMEARDTGEKQGWIDLSDIREQYK